MEFLMVAGLDTPTELLDLTLIDLLTAKALVVLTGLLMLWNSLPPVEVPSFPSSSKIVCS